ncbi:calcium-binding protein [Amaricoccus macauensis]|uniref:calcium-binding protein n=1 Tax=Amaricoccus macauensis TaxID=57001 RepID=UPI003C7DEE9F
MSTPVFNMIDGTSSSETLTGTAMSDLITGYNGNDRIIGQAGNDKLIGSNGSDTLFGGNGNDTLFGGNGNDILVGGNGLNRLVGGVGADEFVLRTGGKQIIADFSAYEGDTIRISGADLLGDDGRVDLSVLSVRDSGRDLILESRIDGETEILARFKNASGYELSQIIASDQLGDIPGSTSTRATIDLDTPISGQFDFTRDQDWYKFEAQAGTIYSFTIEADPTAAKPANLLDLDVRNSAGRLVDALSHDNFYAGAEVIFESATNQTLHIAAVGHTPGGGGFTLRAEEFESDDTVAGDTSSTARLNVGQTVRGSIDYYGDEDWYRAVLEGGDTYVFELSGDTASSNPLPDTYLELYDATGRLIASNDNANGSSNSELVYTPDADQIVFAAAESFAGIHQGDFALSLDTLA